MENNLVTFDKSVLDFKNDAEAIRARFEVEAAISHARAWKEAWDQRFIELKNSGECSAELAMSETEKIYIANEKVEKFRTAEIYDLFSVSDQLRDILPANPAFRKRGLEVYLGNKDEVKKYIDVTYTDKVRVQKIDTAFLK